MPDTALITGASSGIGAAFARLHAKRGGNLVLTARRKAELAALKAELEAAHGITAHVIALDLGAAGGAAALVAAVDALGVEIDSLINNAGFGGHGLHVERDLAQEQSMIDLNVKALVALTHAFGGRMAARGRGRILNVGSTAGFAPGPQQAVYFATKAFVNSFSQAIDHELRPRGVTCTVLAPGYVETEFAAVAALEGTGLVRQRGATADSVAQVGYDAMMAGRLVAVNQLQLSIVMQWIVPLLPRRMVLSMIDRMQTK